MAATLDAADEENEVLSYTVTAGPQFGVLSGTAPEFVYLPAAGFVGIDQFTFTASDGEHSSEPATVTITVHAAYCGVSNTAPVFQSAVDEIEIVLPAGAFTAQEVATFLAVDEEGGVTYSLGSGGDLFSIDPQTGVLQIIAAPPLGGALEMDLEVIATDECGKKAEKIVNVKILPAGDPAGAACRVVDSKAEYFPDPMLLPNTETFGKVGDYYLEKDAQGHTLRTAKKITFTFAGDVTPADCAVVQWRKGQTYTYDIATKRYELASVIQYGNPLPQAAYSDGWTIDSGDIGPAYTTELESGANWISIVDRPSLPFSQGQRAHAEMSFQTCVYVKPLPEEITREGFRTSGDAKFKATDWTQGTIPNSAVACKAWEFFAVAEWKVGQLKPSIISTGQAKK